MITVLPVTIAADNHPGQDRHRKIPGRDDEATPRGQDAGSFLRRARAALERQAADPHLLRVEKSRKSDRYRDVAVGFRPRFADFENFERRTIRTAARSMIVATLSSSSARCSTLTRTNAERFLRRRDGLFRVSIVASATAPTTCVGRLGLIESIKLSAQIFWPLMTMGYFAPSFDASRQSRSAFDRALFVDEIASGDSRRCRPAACRAIGRFVLERDRRSRRICFPISDPDRAAVVPAPPCPKTWLSETFLDVFSSNRLTRYDIPGSSSPTGQYSRTR